MRTMKLSTRITFLVCVAILVANSQALQTFLPSRRSDVSRSKHFMLHAKNAGSEFGGNRRRFLGVIAGACGLVVGEGANAKDELFKPNPLTNPVLEQLRIWEQAEADNLKYGGELEAGDAGNKGKVSAYPTLLMPILKIDQELEEVKRLVRDDDRTKSWPKALAILQNEQYDKIPFKKTFNAYGDNIYYSDPDRANLYLGGGATPKTEQSLAYLLRNDVLTNIENLRAELEYLLKSGETDVEDLYSFAEIATSAMKKYLAIVPPNELEEAKKMISQS